MELTFSFLKTFPASWKPAQEVREKNIIKDRKLSEDPKTLDELSKEYKISRERIRQIEERAFQKLQMEMLNLAKEKKLIQA